MINFKVQNIKLFFSLLLKKLIYFEHVAITLIAFSISNLLTALIKFSKNPQLSKSRMMHVF